MSLVPDPFRRASIPLSPSQWADLRQLLQIQIVLHAHVRKGPNTTIHQGTSHTDLWHAWLEGFMLSDEVYVLLDRDATAEMWGTRDGRARVIEAVKPVVVVMAWIERVRRGELGGNIIESSEQSSGESGNEPDSGAGGRGGGRSTARTILGPPFVVPLT
ncbi:hypothetical protein HOY82DRAFT_607493 [Tuber indicum]|nr:hypothetical protein HOY82DRAFT_607493 [Tuber indicum]